MAHSNREIVRLSQEIKQGVEHEFRAFCKRYTEEHCSFLLDKASPWLATLDVTLAHAVNAVDFGYCMPCIQSRSKENAYAYIDARSMRHPIVERLQDQVEYIVNDVQLGVGEHSGWLLYGVNCCGKSTLSKAVSLCVIMAQAGSFVPCQSFTFYPYESVHTRIPSGDDLFRNMSTFAVELFELRKIISRATRNSLIVGDEVAHGSESLSALAIVASSIQHLCNVGASFIFATHLHQLVEIPDIRTLKNQGKLDIYHLEVHYDNVTKALIYDRKLMPGSGSPVYGLEVCKAFDFPSVFMENAFNIRDHLLVGDESTTSRYNARVMVHECQVCGVKATEVHHIVPQEAAVLDKIRTEDGRVFHKNAKHNLVALCDDCHSRVHHGALDIKGYHMTTEGAQLVYENNTKVTDDIPETDKDHILELLRGGVTKADIQRRFGLSRYRIDRILKSNI